MLGVLSLISLLSSAAAGQDDEEKNRIFLHISYGLDLPVADLNERFGTSFQLGAGAGYLTKKNLLIGGEFKFLFGSTVDEDVLEPLRAPEGFIIGRDMEFASVFLRERGWQMRFKIGKLIPFQSSKARQGIFAQLGAGYLAHRIRIVDDFDSVSQLAGDRRRGYDRLSGGLSISQTLGYLYLDHNRLLNFFAALDFNQAFTKSLRKFNYDTGMEDLESRFDVLVGFRIGWIFPLNFESKTIYY